MMRTTLLGEWPITAGDGLGTVSTAEGRWYAEVPPDRGR